MRHLSRLAVAALLVLACGTAHAGSGISDDGSLEWTTDYDGLSGIAIIPLFVGFYSGSVAGDGSLIYTNSTGDYFNAGGGNRVGSTTGGGTVGYGPGYNPDGSPGPDQSFGYQAVDYGPTAYSTLFAPASPKLYFGALLNFGYGDYSLSFNRNGVSVLTILLPPNSTPIFPGFFGSYLNVSATGASGYDSVTFNVGPSDARNYNAENFLSINNLSVSNISGSGSADVDEPRWLALIALLALLAPLFVRSLSAWSRVARPSSATPA